MALSFERLHPTIGAKVTGIDASRPATEDQVEELVEALPTFGVLVFPEQHIEDGDQVAFGRAFGALEILPEPEKRKKAHPEIFDLTNVRPDGALVDFDESQSVFLRGTERWHTDSSYREIPCLASMLYAVEVPDEGGETEFANMYAAYEALPESRKAELDGLRVVHSYEYSRSTNPGRMEPMDEAEKAKLPPVEHPLVRRHTSGRKSLYLGTHASHIAGMAVEEGRAMLQELQDFATRERFIHQHRWSPRDLVVWDNRCTLHRLRPYDIASKRRVMRRITVAGDGPVA